MRIRGVDVARSRMVCPRLAKSRPLSCNTLDISLQSMSTAHDLHEIGSPFFRTRLSLNFRPCRRVSRSRSNRRRCMPQTGWTMTCLHAPLDSRI